LGTSFGRGGATTFQQDLQNSDCIVIMGSNMAECHPVGFQWVIEARERGAKVIHIDPRFTRTSAAADLHVPIRAGSDIAFLGAIVNYILQEERDFREYVVNYTNAANIVRADFRDSEDLDGLFSGWQAQDGRYDVDSWQYEGVQAPAPAEQHEGGAAAGEQHGSHGGFSGRREPLRDPALQHPRCVFQILKKHFRRYTPELVEELCGVSREEFFAVARALCENSGRERTSAFCYSVGWTQHSVGVQYIRTAAIIQLLLGNIGRPGGGILALRGHASIQGSTDIPTLYNLLPGYIPMPHAALHADLAAFIKNDIAKAGYWGHMDAYVVSLLKAYWGAAATAENDFCFDYLPRISGDHSTYQTMMGMLEGTVRGFFVVGENPAVGSANGGLQRQAMAKLDWLVVRDLVECESASFWYDAPEIETGALRSSGIKTEVFFMPAAAHTEKDGSFTQTQRLLQWHHKAVEPQGDARSELWFYYHLGKKIREKLAASRDPKDRPLLDLSWEYPVSGPHAEPEAEAVLREINGWDADQKPLGSFSQLRADGSTACGCWIYCGCYKDGVNQTARRTPRQEQHWVAPEWGWAWPANRRILYNRASADPSGKPWSERKKYVWWDDARGAWTGFDAPDCKHDMRPDYRPRPDATAENALSGAHPFVMQEDGVGWLYVPNGIVDGPLPVHYEPHESPVVNPLYAQGCNPLRQRFDSPCNPYNARAKRNAAAATSAQPGGEGADGDDPDDDVFPYVMTTYRLTEHHTAGGMSRFLRRLSQLQPAMFCEVSPQLAAQRGLQNGGWATIITSRTAIEARVLVTWRMQALRVGGRALHQVGLPYHWGWRGLTSGGAANDLFPIVLDPNVHIQEAKAATCDIQPGRRPRGAQLTLLLAKYRSRSLRAAGKGQP
jgi:formate dehydrogenase major subunit